ncbi:MAG: KH domain-containing protein [Coriobacteriales bacterium]|jgi:predicted RNA-binding protein YlqC (UPF0109 family)|nr:KH domain-containing protein [Coriobacteriales bacterium]
MAAQEHEEFDAGSGAAAISEATDTINVASATDLSGAADSAGIAGAIDAPAGASSVDAKIDKVVLEVVCAVVDTPEAVQVSSVEEGQSLVVEIRVAEGEAGKIIGRQGRIIKSLRTLARAASSYMDGGHVEVEIID